ncbi:MAG: chemotaxis protein CheA [Planctomycetota bacterium]
MSFVTAIQRLRACSDRFDGVGTSAAAELGKALRDVAAESSAPACDALADLFAACSATIEALLADEGLASHGAEVRRHVAELLDYAEAWARAQESGAELDRAPPSPLQLGAARARRQHEEAVGMFVGNALGALAELEEDLLTWETEKERQGDALDAVRRIVHTLKAEFGALGLRAAQELCHLAETAIDAVSQRDHDQKALVDALLAFGDHVKHFVEQLARDVDAAFEAPSALSTQLQRLGDAAVAPEATGDGGDARVEQHVDGDFADSLPEFVGEARGHLADAEVAMVELAQDPGDVERLNLTFRAFHTIKGVAGFLNLAAVVELAHVAETLLDGGRSGRFRFDAADIDLVLAAGDMIQQLLAALEGEPAPRRADWEQLKAQLQARGDRAADAPADAPADATTDVTNEATTPAGAPARAGSSDAEPDARPAAASVTAPDPVVRPQPPRRAKPARVERTVKVSTTRLDMLVDMVGELVIAQSMVLQSPEIQALDGQALTRNISQVGKITRDLQEAAMSLRMVTVKATFQKMARLVRDVAGKSGKRVGLTIAGEDTELDRNVVEQIADPLVHMIRNAVDHGVEAPAERVAAGKPEEGRLTLRAYHQGGSIVIEIRDDGRGIDRDKVFEKARSKGLIPAGTDATSLTDAEVFQLIFAPGFSTAEAVTDLSGRGVGMDVVRRNIEALRGKIEIESEVGAGTTFHLRLPLTLAIIDGMIVRIGASRYVVPTLSIEHSFRPRPEDVHRVADRGECVQARGEVLPVHRLKHLFGQPDGVEALEQGILVVVEVDGQRSCLLVDEIVGQQQVVIKSLGMSREQVSGLSGGAIMTDGRVALILDVATLVGAVPTT